MKDPDTAPALELIGLILAGGEPIHNFVIQLGTAYEERDTGWPMNWASKVVQRLLADMRQFGFPSVHPPGHRFLARHRKKHKLNG